MFKPAFFSRSVALLTVIAAGVLITACGESTVDQDSLQSGVESILESDVDVDSVSCPDDISQDEGTEFECSVTAANGEEIQVGGTITGIDGEDVLFELQTVNGKDVT